jgi:tripartite ATP-independent transporter DctM subunit
VNEIVGLVSILGMLVLIQTGMHIAVALLLLSFAGVWFIRGDFLIAGDMLSLAARESIASYSFGVIPLFVLMGLFVSVSGVGRDTFDVASHVFRRLRGGLGMATVAANAVFAAVNGTSIASASVFTRIAVPELLRLGYTPRFSVGIVAGSSVLGMLIPPSLLLILYGIIGEVSIGQLFTAGIVPGLLLSVLFCLTIVLLVLLRPSFVMAADGGPGNEAVPDEAILRLAAKSAPILLLILVVLGGIYGGVFTPTEAGAVGALGALLLALYRRSLGGGQFWHVLTETGHVTAAISFLLIAAHLYATMLALSGLPGAISDWTTSSGLGHGALLIGYLVLIILLGTILDSASIMLIVLPLALPVAASLGVDLVWFGIVTVIAVEIGLLTPPLGVACFVIKANLDDDRITLGDIFAGAFPFAVTMLFALALVILVPGLATILL